MRRPDLDPLKNRQPNSADETLEDGLVHADGRSRDARAGIRQLICLEKRLDGAILTERPVQSREDDGAWVPAGHRLESLGRRRRPFGSDLARIVERSGCGPARSGVGRHRPPAPVEIDEDAIDGVPGLRERVGDRPA